MSCHITHSRTLTSEIYLVGEKDDAVATGFVLRAHHIYRCHITPSRTLTPTNSYSVWRIWRLRQKETYLVGEKDDAVAAGFVFTDALYPIAQSLRSRQTLYELYLHVRVREWVRCISYSRMLSIRSPKASAPAKHCTRIICMLEFVSEFAVFRGH